MANMRNPEFFETRSIPRLLVQFSTPSIIAALVTATYNLVARVFVAQRFGTDGVAAVTVSFPIIVVFLAVAMMIGAGATTLISIRLGERETDKAEETLGQALFLSCVTAAIFIVLGQIFLEPILRFVGASDQILPLAKSYLSVVIWGVLTQHIAFGVNNFIRAEGRPKTAMISMLISAVANGVLDYVFLFVFRTGIWGAGLANVIACLIAAAWVSGLYFSGHTILKWRWKYFRFNWPLARKIAIFGAAPFVMQCCSAILQTTSNNVMGHYGDLYGQAMGYVFDGGDLAIGVMGAAVAVTNMFLMPFLGLGQGMQPIVGYNTGAGRPDRTVSTVKTALNFALYAGLVIWAVAMVKPEWFIDFFLNADEVGFAEKQALGKLAIRGVMLSFPLIPINVLASGYFQAEGRPILALMMTLLRQLVFLLPLIVFSTWFIEKYFGKGLNGFWFSFPIADALACVVSVVFLALDFKNKRRQIVEMESRRAAEPAAAVEASEILEGAAQ